MRSTARTGLIVSRLCHFRKELQVFLGSLFIFFAESSRTKGKRLKKRLLFQWDVKPSPFRASRLDRPAARRRAAARLFSAIGLNRRLSFVISACFSYTAVSKGVRGTGAAYATAGQGDGRLHRTLRAGRDFRADPGILETIPTLCWPSLHQAFPGLGII